MAKRNRRAAVAVGVSMALLAAAAAGYYFLYGKNAAKNRRRAKGWMLRAKGEVVERMEKMKDVSADTYYKIIDSVASRYRRMRNVDPKELRQMVSELRGHWVNIRDQLAGKNQKSTRRSKKKKTA